MAARKNPVNPPKRHARLCECGDHGFAVLTKGYVTLVDPADMALLASRSWGARIDGQTVYAKGSLHSKTVLLHRLILATDKLVDHRNGDGLDNRRQNLREANDSQNTAHRLRQMPGSSGVVGVHKRGQRYYATMNDGSRHVHLGSFSTLDEAVRVRDAGMRAKYGEFYPEQRKPIIGRSEIPARVSPPRRKQHTATTPLTKVVGAFEDSK